jgi:signal peptidase I
VAVSNTDYRINNLLQSEEVFYETVSNEPVDVIVGPDEVFLLNDYRSESSDSRTFGTLSLSEIDGKVVFLFRWRGI